jgi:ABC-type polysaccharide/polyol phosphate export permease
MTAIWRCRFFWWSLVKMDLRTRYRRSLLGMGWSLLHPIAMTAVLCLVFHKIFHVDVRDYGPFLLAGLATWNYLVASALQGCQCFFQGESYIRQYPAPLAIYPLRTTLGATVHFAIAMAVVTLLTWCIHGFGNLASLYTLVPTFLLLFILGWSIAVLAGFSNVHFQDTQHLAEIGFQMLFYATPVMYRAQQLEGNDMAWIINYNPLATFLQLVREPLLEGRAPAPATFGVAAATVAVVLAAAGLTLNRLQRRLIFHL